MYTLNYLWRHGYRMSTALQLEFCSASNNSSRGYYAFIFQALFSTAFLHLHWGYPSYDEQSGCICLILAVPRQKCRLHRWPHPTLYFISDIGTISLSSRFGNVLHLNDAMLVPKVSLSKMVFGWTTLWWLPKLCYLYSDFLCVVKDLHTHNVIAIGCRP